MTFEVKGWCPGALRPMLSGDGLVVRVRPRLGQLSAAQALGLCDAAQAHGAGLIDVTNRANIQIRGVSNDSYTPLIEALDGLGLIDPNAVIEGRRNILVTPLWQAGDDTEWLALELIARLEELPELPPKMGFVIDAGDAPILTDTPGDFRIERGVSGGLILRPDGHALGIPLDQPQEIDALIRLAYWFAASGGAEAGRMARHKAPLPDWAKATEAPAPAAAPLVPGAHALGAVQGLAFGQVRAADLAQAIRDSGASAIRVTPWRALLSMDAAPGPRAGLEWDANAAVLRADACPGAPYCPQASIETRTLATRLAPMVAGRLHVSGCAKGCARASRADVVVIGHAGAYDLAFDALAGDAPAHAGLNAQDLFAKIGTL